MHKKSNIKKSRPVQIQDVTIIDSQKTKKAISTAAFGNMIEWFDFGVYGFVAFALGKIFFPNMSPSMQIIAALTTFSIPFLFRPIGGIILGFWGDKYGRQRILAATIILMTISTALIGVIPSYQTIGFWAPVFLLILKVAQGISVGGEYAGAAIFVAEYSPDRKRGLLGSWLDFGSILGFLLGAGLVSIIQINIGEQAFLNWGWRIPFLLSLPIGFIGLYLRNTLDETPIFEQHNKDQKKESIGFIDLLKSYKTNLLVCICLVLTTNVTYYMLLTYLPSYLSHNLGYSENHGVLIIIAVMVGMLIMQPIIGYFSDKIGRRPFIFMGSLFLLLFSLPAFYLIISDNVWQIFLGLLVLAISLNMLLGILASSLPALFPTAIRYRGLAATFRAYPKRNYRII